jgi:hypothetical protein
MILLDVVICIIDFVLHGIGDLLLGVHLNITIPGGQIDLGKIQHLKLFRGKPPAIRCLGRSPAISGKSQKRRPPLLLQDAPQLGVKAAIGFLSLKAKPEYV